MASNDSVCRDVNLYIDMSFVLLKIPGVNNIDPSKDLVQIRALSIDGRCPLLSQLSKCASNSVDDYIKIQTAMRIAATTPRNGKISKKHVKECVGIPGVFEFRADKGGARVMFFYQADDLIICTDYFEKQPGRAQTPTEKAAQDKAFARCEQVKTLLSTHSTSP